MVLAMHQHLAGAGGRYVVGIISRGWELKWIAPLTSVDQSKFGGLLVTEG